jgi:hypothetical protein
MSKKLILNNKVWDLISIAVTHKGQWTEKELKHYRKKEKEATK